MKNTIVFSSMIALFVILASPVAAQSDDLDGYAWSETTGWVNARAADGGVTLHLTHLSGFAWAENIGWIKLGADGSGPYANDSPADWGVNRDVAGVLSGYAWSETVGWVNFAPNDGGVTVDPVTSALDGFAWAENVGWIHLREDPVYGVAPWFFADGFESGDSSAWSASAP